MGPPPSYSPKCGGGGPSMDLDHGPGGAGAAGVALLPVPGVDAVVDRAVNRLKANRSLSSSSGDDPPRLLLHRRLVPREFSIRCGRARRGRYQPRLTRSMSGGAARGNPLQNRSNRFATQVRPDTVLRTKSSTHGLAVQVAVLAQEQLQTTTGAFACRGHLLSLHRSQDAPGHGHAVHLRRALVNAHHARPLSH